MYINKIKKAIQNLSSSLHVNTFFPYNRCMSSGLYVIRQCTHPDCRFRYPAETDLKRAHLCPKCGADAPVAAEIYPYSSPQLIEPLSQKPTLSALLDNIRSTFNVGAIFRTADGAGFEHIHLCGITPTPENPKVGKTALGAEKNIPWSYANNSLQAARELKERGAVLWALEGTPQAVPLNQATHQKPDTPLVLVAGNEITGVDPELLALCERVVWIPMRGQKESLNVAVAFSIAAYSLRFA
jgi:23S rRNA (guanosine2251-2'-O)-methyltransferase